MKIEKAELRKALRTNREHFLAEMSGELFFPNGIEQEDPMFIVYN